VTKQGFADLLTAVEPCTCVNSLEPVTTACHIIALTNQMLVYKD